MKRSGDRVIARDRVIGEAAYICHPERAGANATASRRTPAMSVPKHAASGSSHEAANLTTETRSRGENQKPTTEARRHGESKGENKCPEPECIQLAEQVSGHDFSRAEKDKKNWALAPATVGRALTDHPITYEQPITRFTPALALIKNAICTLRATLREIFDESAYDRFLLRTRATRSITSYRAFTSERDSAMLKKPRCC